MLNFTWWVNRDTEGANVFEAASSGSTTSASSTAARRCDRGRLEQSDGTSWMGIPLNMLAMAMELATRIRLRRAAVLVALPARATNVPKNPPYPG
jgi:hypothetical protein